MADTNSDHPGSSKDTIEKVYQKKTQLEHILLRPDTYIGSVERTTEKMWVWDKESELIVQKEITYVPGLYKIFDEILVNAADNKQRDPKMDTIKIDINQSTNTISVFNNGTGIPIVIHKGEKIYVPTMIFGHLLTSTNYNDEEEKVTGGRNGYGAKLCNIFSTKFTVETSSKEYKKSFKQTWASNMSKASEPKIKEFDKEYTKVTFNPDLARFKMESLEDDIVSLMTRRAYDIAVSTNVKVFLNGKKLHINKMMDYINLYIKGRENENGGPLKVCYQIVNDRWQVACTISDQGFQQVSFVNSIATTKGGKHVDHVADMIVKKVLEILKKKNKAGINIKPFQVKNHMWLFVNCLIVNPTFDSQTKENMTLQAKSFGSKCVLSDDFINSIAKCGIVESVLSWASFKAQTELVKSSSGRKQTRLKDIPKLEDANEAGTKNSHLCTLIITEGDSAKSLAIVGLGIVGRDRYGVFPLKGKPLNVRDATHKQIKENLEINNIIKIIGLQYKKKYLTLDDLKTLRYGKLMIMADQDQDGSHIKGLVINFIHHNWPDLLKLPFLEEFITPIVKVTKGNHSLSFYSLPEYREWKRDTPNYQTFHTKYYKGLGTSSNKEVKEYFSNMTRHRICFKYGGENDDHNIDLAFSKKGANQRKEWLTNHMDEVKRRKEIGLSERYLYTKDTQAVSYSDFINLELVLFSNADNIRSIPSMIDGFKPGQRKVLFTCIKRNDKREVRVSQLAGSIAEHSAYHHGEASLCATIVNLAQNFVGSNNLNLLEPIGQFGTRLAGGKDSASARYIHTKMSPLTRLIFHPADDPLLTHEYDDNQRIEPVFYIPIIPMVLVNGAEGIGTGWSTKIPTFNPRDIIKNIKRMLDDEDPLPMHPWYKNFRGTIEPFQDKYVISGEAALLSENRIEITELPIGSWTNNYKEHVLEPMLGSDKVKPLISDYSVHCTEAAVKFVVTMLPGKLAEVQAEGIHKVFKLQTTISLSIMNAFNEHLCLQRFEKVEDMLKNFYNVRLHFYEKRRNWIIGQLEAEACKLTNQARFIVEKCDRILVIENKKKAVLFEEMVKGGYDPDPVAVWKKKMARLSGQEEEEHSSEGEEDPIDVDIKPVKGDKSEGLTNSQKYDYLLGMSMWMLTKEKKDELLKQRDQKYTELNAMKAKTPAILWKEDLDALWIKLEEVEKKERQDDVAHITNAIKKEKGAKGGRGAKEKKPVDAMPSPDGIRVEPKIHEDLMKRIYAAEKLKLKKEIKKEYDPDDPNGVSPIGAEKKVRAPKVKKEKVPKEGKDGLKQTKLSFKKESPDDSKKSPKKNAKKKKLISDSEDDVDLSGSDVSFTSEPVIPRERPNARRAASKVNKYANSEESKSDSDEPELYENKTDGDSFKPQTISDSDSDDLQMHSQKNNAKNNTTNSDDLFNSLIDNSAEIKSNDTPPAERKVVISDSDSDAALVPPPGPSKKTAAKRKLMKLTNNGTKRSAKIDSDSDDELEKKKPKKAAKKVTKKKNFGSDSDDFAMSDGSDKGAAAAGERIGGGRAKKPTKYTFKDETSDDDF